MGERVVRVLPDEAAIDKVFDYTVPPTLAAAHLVAPGTEVRIELHGRRVGGWVLAVDVEPHPGVALRPIAKVRGVGPTAEVIGLATWMAWRWGGRTAQVLRFANPPTPVRALPPPARPVDPGAPSPDDPLALLMQRALMISAPTVIRTPPGSDRYGMVLAACRHAALHPTSPGALVITPSAATAAALARRLRRSGVPVALLPDEWAKAAAGGHVVIGARAAVLAPIPDASLVLVLDEHDESMHDERTPTWNARDAAVERARRLGVPCVLTSPVPSLEALAHAGEHIFVPPRRDERAGWAMVQVIDRAGEEPGRQGLIAPGTVTHLRSEGRVICVLNRTGRAKLLACAACTAIVTCETCGAAVGQPGAEPVLVCPRCTARRPLMCTACGASRLKAVRMGVSRARDELEALALRPVGEVTGSTDELPDTPVLVGTEAVLHRVDRADVVVFLDLDAELLAPRYRAAEQTMALVARASRLVAGRQGRVVLQTRQPQHEVVQAAVLGDPGRLVEPERDRRRLLRFPPYAGACVISGAACDEWAERLRQFVPAVSVSGGAGGPYLVRADEPSVLADVIAAVDEDRPAGRVRIETDPLRI